MIKFLKWCYTQDKSMFSIIFVWCITGFVTVMGLALVPIATITIIICLGFYMTWQEYQKEKDNDN